jgi:VCBS repeat-containing protein
MKKILLPVALFCMAAFASCNGDDFTLRVSQPAEVSAVGGEVAFGIEADTYWTIAATDDWYTLNITSGNTNATITITVEKNDTGVPRTSTITVTGGGKTAIVTLNQADAVLKVSDPVPAIVPAGGGSATFDIAADIDWEIAQPAENWITVSPRSGTGNQTVAVTVNENTGGRREAVITVTAVIEGAAGEDAVISEAVTVSQAAGVTTDYTIDDLVGEWNVTSDYVDARRASNWPMNYTVTFTKVDDTTLSISNFLNLAAQRLPAGDNNVTATFDALNQSISIPVQRLDPTIDVEAWPSTLYPYRYDAENNFMENWNDRSGFVNIPVGDLSIDFTTGYNIGIGLQGESLMASFIVLSKGINDSNPDVVWYEWCFANSVFTKAGSSPAPETTPAFDTAPPNYSRSTFMSGMGAR